MKKHLKWYVNSTDMWDNIRRYKAVFEAKIAEGIEFYIGFYVFMDNADDWYLSIIQTAPNPNAKNITKKCYHPDIGKKMAEDYLEEIFDGMRKLLGN